MQGLTVFCRPPADAGAHEAGHGVDPESERGALQRGLAGRHRAAAGRGARSARARARQKVEPRGGHDAAQQRQQRGAEELGKWRLLPPLAQVPPPTQLRTPVSAKLERGQHSMQHCQRGGPKTPVKGPILLSIPFFSWCMARGVAWPHVC